MKRFSFSIPVIFVFALLSVGIVIAQSVPGIPLAPQSPKSVIPGGRTSVASMPGAPKGDCGISGGSPSTIDQKKNMCFFKGPMPIRMATV